jgi:hypothetical protein
MGPIFLTLKIYKILSRIVEPDSVRLLSDLLSLLNKKYYENLFYGFKSGTVDESMDRFQNYLDPQPWLENTRKAKLKQTISPWYNMKKVHKHNKPTEENMGKNVKMQYQNLGLRNIFYIKDYNHGKAIEFLEDRYSSADTIWNPGYSRARYLYGTARHL